MKRLHRFSKLSHGAKTTYFENSISLKINWLWTAIFFFFFFFLVTNTKVRVFSGILRKLLLIQNVSKQMTDLQTANYCNLMEKTLESPLDCKEIQPVHSEGDQPWVFFGRNDAKAETPVLWPPHVKSWLTGKDSDAGRDWGQKEKGMTEDEMAGWHHRLKGRESEWTPGVGDGQGGLVCCDSWGRKESNTTDRLNWTDTTRHDRETEMTDWLTDTVDVVYTIGASFIPLGKPQFYYMSMMSIFLPEISL